MVSKLLFIFYIFRYPEWFLLHDVQVNVIGDLIGSFILGYYVSPKQCEGILKFWRKSSGWSQYSIAAVGDRIAARTRDTSIFGYAKNYIKYIFTKDKSLLEAPKF